MKFDELYKFMINEASELEDKNEFEEPLVPDGADLPSMDVTEPMDDIDPATMSDSQKIDYLMQNAELWNKDGLPTSKLQVHANIIAQNGELFKMLFDKIESKKTPADTFGADDMDLATDEALPPEAATDDIDQLGDEGLSPEDEAELNRTNM